MCIRDRELLIICDEMDQLGTFVRSTYQTFRWRKIEKVFISEITNGIRWNFWNGSKRTWPNTEKPDGRRFVEYSMITLETLTTIGGQRHETTLLTTNIIKNSLRRSTGPNRPRTSYVTTSVTGCLLYTSRCV